MLTSPLPTNAELCVPPELGATGHRPPSFDYCGAGRERASMARTHDHQTPTVVGITPPNLVTRQKTTGHAMTAEFVQATKKGRTEYRFRAPVHLLAMFENASRDDGESYVEGLPRSTLRDLTRKMTFIPAGHDYYEWQQPRSLTRLMFFYFDPGKLGLNSDFGINLSLEPRLFFEDAALWESAIKLKRSIECTTPDNQLYFDAVGVVLIHELVRLYRTPQGTAHNRGGLAARQQRTVRTYIEEHLDEKISLATLAKLAELSPFHFCRAFKQSFGTAPHRYHTDRRIDRAKAMLAKRTFSVTEIGFAVGYAETSAFCTTFRKATGVSPRGYQRSLQ